MRIVTQQIDKTNEVCPRLGLIFADGLFAGSKFVQFVFPNSPCDLGGLLSNDIILRVGRISLDEIHRVDFSDRRRTDLDFEIWRSFRRSGCAFKSSPEPFAPVGEIVEVARAFVAQCPHTSITFRNPDVEYLSDLLERFSQRTRTGSLGRRRP